MQRRTDAAAEWVVLVTVGFSGMLVPLNSTMIAVALPRIARDLDASLAQAGWLATAYLIVMAALQPVTGKLGDRFGRRPFLLGGVAAFGASSVLAAIAPSITLLIAFRCGQAIAGAVILPNGIALLREIVPAERRGARFGLLGSAIAFGAAIGPPVGGVLIQAGGWPAIFWMNAPLTAFIVALGWRTLPQPRRRRPGIAFDFGGAAMLAAALASAAWLLTRLQEMRVSVFGVFAAGIAVLLIIFVRRELRHEDPVVQPRFFRRRTFAAATGGIALSNLTMYALILAIPQLLARRPAWSEAEIGLIITAMSAGMVLLAPAGGRLSDRLGRRVPAAVGMTLLAGGVTSLALIGPDASGPVLVATLAAAGAGLGLGSGSLQTAAVESIEVEHAGMAAAASATSRYLGSIVGAAVLAGLATSAQGFQTVFTMTAIAAIASIVLALGLPSRQRRLPRDVDAAAVPAP